MPGAGGQMFEFRVRPRLRSHGMRLACMRLLPIIATALLATTVRDLQPVVETEPLRYDVDDPAIWVNPQDPAQSLIVATVKRPRPHGGLAVYTLDGKLVEMEPGLDRPNNVDIY